MKDQALISHAQQFIQGGPARLLAANGLNVNALRTNDLLRKEEWQLLDETLVGVARQRLIGIADLKSKGLAFNLGGLGVILSQYETLGDMSDANISFAEVTDGEKDSVNFAIQSVPVPIIHKDFSINIRRLQASRGPSAIGQPIDTTQITTASEKVVEQMEEMLFNGINGSLAQGGSVQSGNGSTTQNSLYGYTTEPNINSQAGSDWATYTNPQTDVINAIGVLEGDRYFGPYTLYAATTQFGELRNFATDGSGDQVFDRLKRLQGLSDVKPGDRLTAGTGVLVSMRKDVVDLAIGQDLTVVEWETKGGLMLHFKVLSALAVRVKADQAGGSGVCRLTGI